MRATIEKNQRAATDPYGEGLPPDWQAVAVEPCWAWWTSVTNPISDTRAVHIRTLLIMLGTHTVAVEGARVATVKSRRGAEIFKGPYVIRGLMPREGYFEATLEKVAA